MVPMFPIIPGAPIPPHGAHPHPQGGGAGGTEVDMERVPVLQAVGLPVPGGALLMGNWAAPAEARWIVPE